MACTIHHLVHHGSVRMGTDTYDFAFQRCGCTPTEGIRGTWVRLGFSFYAHPSPGWGLSPTLVMGDENTVTN
jgi:hypothetical protein